MTRPRILICLGMASALALGACASREPLYPVREAPPPPSPPPVPQSPPPPPIPSPNENGATPAPSTNVESNSLPPIGAAGAVGAPGQAVAQARIAPAPPPALETPRQVTIAPGETLFDVAERVRTPVRAIIELNNLEPPYSLQAGATLRIPPPMVYEVRAGDTLFGISRRFSIDPRSLANLNDFALEAPIRPGQKIALPALARDSGSNAQASGGSPNGMTRMASAASSTPARAASSRTASAAPAASAASTNLSDAAVAAAGRGRFTWPLHGEVLSRFGPLGPGQRNDGLNIAADAGEPVKAAAAGEVVFAGALPGFGNLVLLKHDGGWVTAYAHLSKLEVKMREQVSQNQEVGQAGQTGQVDRPQLHFEVRYAANPKDKAKPVDPTLLLPG